MLMQALLAGTAAVCGRPALYMKAQKGAALAQLPEMRALLGGAALIGRCSTCLLAELERAADR